MLLRSILFGAAILGIASLGLIGCNGPQADPWEGAPEPRVVTTFAPIHCFALNVVGDQGSVRSLLSTQGPHHADPPTSQAKMLAKANLFFANGLEVDDSIASKMAKAMGRGGPKVIKLANDIPKNLLIEGICECCKDEEEDHDHEDPNHIEYDGHVWLGIPQAKFMVEKMANDIGNISGDKAKNMTERGQAYCKRLDKLHADGLAMLKDKKDRAILPFHGSLAYFAKSFDLKIIKPIQAVPGQEPTAKQMDEVVKNCIAANVRVIAVEPQYGAGTSAKAIFDVLKSKGLDPVIVVIDPLETATDAEFNKDWYETKMRANLEALAKNLR